MKYNRIKEALNQGRAVAGVMVSELKTTMLGLLLEAANARFAIIDMEHGAYNNETLANVINGFNGVECVPFVRVPDIRREYFLTPLELGAAGVLAPRVESKSDAQRCVYYSKYSPQGDRGVSLMRAHTLFNRVNPDAYMQNANDNIMVMVQIETAAALENLDDILSTEGVDVAFIGPSDICQSLDIKGGIESPQMMEVIDRIVECSKNNGKAVGIHVYDTALALKFIDKGIRFVSCNTDANALVSSWSASINGILGQTKEKSGQAETD